jgi:hypothetical protein
MFEYEFKQVVYVDTNGNRVGSELQIRNRLVTIVVGALTFGEWSAWDILNIEEIVV